MWVFWDLKTILLSFYSYFSSVCPVVSIKVKTMKNAVITNAAEAQVQKTIITTAATASSTAKNTEIKTEGFKSDRLMHIRDLLLDIIHIKKTYIFI